MRSTSWPKRLIQALRRTREPRGEPYTGRSGYQYSAAGEFLTPDTAITLDTVWRAVCYLSAQVATPPWMVRKRRADNPKASDTQYDDPISKLLSVAPNPWMTAFSFREVMQATAMLRGNAYGEIERDRFGRPLAIWYIPTDRADIKRSDMGELEYEFTGASIATVRLPARDVFHLHGLGPEGITGYDVLGYAADTFGLGRALLQYGGSFFRNGGWPGVVITSEKRLNDQSRKRLREGWDEFLRGSRKSWKTLILGDSTKVDTLTMPNDDAQFLESRKFNIYEISRWLGVPPTKLYELENAHYNNAEWASKEVMVDTVIPWMRRWEQEADLKLLNSQFAGRYTKFEISSVLAGNLEARAEYYSKLFKLGALSSNDIREKEGENPVEGGDRYFIEGNNMVPLDRVDDMATLNQPEGANVDTPAAEPEETSADDEEEVAAAARVMDKMAAHERPDLVLVGMEKLNVEA